MITPARMETAPRKTDIPHCRALRRVVDKALSPKKMIIICPPTVTTLILIKYQFRLRPSKMLRLLSRRRQLFYHLSEKFVTRIET